MAIGIGRRQFISVLAGAAAAWPLATSAQQPSPVRRIGVLMGYSESDPEAQAFVATFVQELQKLGWSESVNIHIEYRWSAGDVERMRTYAKQLVAYQPDVIVANTTPVTAALQRETRTIPIVFVIVSDPVGAGFIQSLSKPGGNITGFINLEASVGGKWLDLLKEIAPEVTRVALMYNPATAPGAGMYFQPAFETAARSLAVMPIIAPVHDDTEIERAITTLGQEPGGGLVVMTDGFMLGYRAKIISLTARLRVPAVYPFSHAAKEGGLISFSQDTTDIFRRAAPYVDRILRGEKPSDLPAQVPIKYEIRLNLKTAKALGLTIPQTLLVTADEVIE